MYYTGTNLIGSLKVADATKFARANVCEIFTFRDGGAGRRVGSLAMVSSVSGDTVNLTFSSLPIGINDHIEQGDVLRLFLNPDVSSEIIGDFMDFNDGSPHVGKSIDEPNYDAERHDLLNYESDGSTPLGTQPINFLCMRDSDFSPLSMDYTGLVYAGRTDAPRGHRNGMGSRIAVLITRQHLLMCDHYPPTTDTMYACADSVRFTITKRTNTEQGSTGFTYNALGNGVMILNRYPEWYMMQNGGETVRQKYSDIPMSAWSQFHDAVVQTFKNPVPARINPIRLGVTADPDRHFAVDSALAFVNNSWLTVSAMRFVSVVNQMAQAKVVNSPWAVMPSGVRLTDMQHCVAAGDSGSLLLHRHSQGTIFMGAALSGGTAYGLTVSSDGTFSCTPPAFDGSGICSFDDRSTNSVINTGVSLLTPDMKRVLEIILSDLSWQTTQLQNPSNPNKNISETDIIHTSAFFVDLDSSRGGNNLISCLAWRDSSQVWQFQRLLYPVFQ